MKIFLIVIIFIIIMLVASLLGAKNDQAVMFDYLMGTMEMRLSILLMSFFAAGVIFSSLVFTLVWLKLKWRINRLQKRNRTTDIASS
ncbi:MULTISPECIES: lipopolysaccharide assembly protein LapA domain-containing protein [Aliiglaciecola]|uniref:lipopolysaccharide assembly protein LapA domain-containing protein n=1 Tax=Aliiglaciecola TaxID=1406885 RepID=UPI001C09BFDA|nr:MULTISPECIES: LapA family protein [Aliiglaciecola]MBU2876410.1 LapA family protein [Aliiglaciecola lipolytica]MDO6712728.1 LapA family protein [Aliiglaciecola sp. 2_MG-2023]MDO6753873.1 LapA family protein [Aliiglaciecola sp. 1_MG-2023]